MMQDAAEVVAKGNPVLEVVQVERATMSAQATGLSSSQIKVPQMYSHAGASFQEWALRLLDRKGSIAHRSIGRFVMAINNGRITIGQAEAAYMVLLNMGN
jgi:hypothetical protein